MKRLTLAMIAVWCVIGLLVIFAMVSGAVFNWKIGNSASSFVSGASNTELVVDENVSLENIKSLKLSFSSDSCRVFLVDGNEMNVKHYVRGIPKERYVKVLRDNDTVTVTTKEEGRMPFSLFSSPINNYSLVEVYLPKSYKDALNVDVSSGSMDIDGALDLSGIDMRTSSGEISSNSDIKATQANITVTSGEINLAGKVDAERYEIKTSSGSLKIASRLTGSGTIGLTSGEIKLDGGVEAGNYAIKVSSGMLKVGSCLTGSGTVEVTSGTAKLSGVDIAESLDVGVSSGSIRVELAGDPSLKFTGQKSSGTLKTYFDTYSDDKNRVFASVGEEPYKKLNVRVTSGDVRVTSAEGGATKQSADPFDSDDD